MDIGSAVGRQEGLTEEKLRGLADPGDRADVFSAQERVVLAYAEALTATPVDVPDALFSELREHFDEVQIVELTSCLAWQNYRARFDHALHIEAEGFSDGAFCPLPAATTPVVTTPAGATEPGR